MSRSVLMATLRRAYKMAQTSIETGIPADELIDLCHQKVSRRHLIRGGLFAAGTLAAASWRRDGGAEKAIAADRKITKVLVVGAGIAGLTAAYRLNQAGVPVDIIEARNQVGGRIRSLPNIGRTNITVDVGGEFIDTDHASLRSLAAELGLSEVDLIETQKGLTKDTFYFQGRKIPLAEITRDFVPLANKINADLASIGDELSYRGFTKPAERLDKTSISQYVDQSPISSTLKQLLKIGYTTEYGREAEEQSSLNLLFLIGTDREKFELYGGSDERYQIAGGNSQITRLLADRLGNSIDTGTILEAISTLSDGRYRVALRSGERSFDRTYERVVLTLPFTLLRQVQLNVDLPPVKRLAINTLGYGTNSKLVTAYRERIWRDRYNSTASIFTDTGFQNSWEASPFTSGSAGLITNFTGGSQGVSIGRGTPESQAQLLLPQYEQVFPGISQLNQGQPLRVYWTGEQFSQGSYSCYLVGQWTKLYGSEGERVGNLFFAGEHCSLEYQGYMEGACETGETAALEILQDLGLGASGEGVRSRRALNRQNRRRPSRRVPRAMTI